MRTCDWRAFDPRVYLAEYYSDVGEENLAILRFYADVFRSMSPKNTMLDFGSGPTIYSLISAVTRVQDIHVVEYLEANRLQLRKWLHSDKTAFDWSHFIRAALHIEDNNASSATHILQRAAQMRDSVTSIGKCDVRQMPPLAGPQQYDVVSSNFCAESITDSRQEWRAFVGNIASLVASGGILLMTTLKKATCYSVGRVFFPAVSIDESDLTTVLQDSGFSPQHLVIRSVAADRPSRHYKGLILAAAMKLG